MIIVSIYLLIIGWIDFKTYRIPNYLSIPLIVWSGYHHQLEAASLLGGFWGYIHAIIANRVHLAIYQKDGIGQGDLKLLIGLGLWLKLEQIVPCMLIASITGIAHSYTMRRPCIAFGPHLCCAAILIIQCH